MNKAVVAMTTGLTLEDAAPDAMHYRRSVFKSDFMDMPRNSLLPPHDKGREGDTKGDGTGTLCEDRSLHKINQSNHRQAIGHGCRALREFLSNGHTRKIALPRKRS